MSHQCQQVVCPPASGRATTFPLMGKIKCRVNTYWQPSIYSANISCLIFGKAERMTDGGQAAEVQKAPSSKQGFLSQGQSREGTGLSLVCRS